MSGPQGGEDVVCGVGSGCLRHAGIGVHLHTQDPRPGHRQSAPASGSRLSPDGIAGDALGADQTLADNFSIPVAKQWAGRLGMFEFHRHRRTVRGRKADKSVPGPAHVRAVGRPATIGVVPIRIIMSSRHYASDARSARFPAAARSRSGAPQRTTLPSAPSTLTPPLYGRDGGGRGRPEGIQARAHFRVSDSSDVNNARVNIASYR